MAGHGVSVHKVLRWGQGRLDQHGEHPVQALAQLAGDHLFPVAKQVPLGEQLQLPLQQGFVIDWQAAHIGMQLLGNQGIDGSAIPLIGISLI